MILQIIECEIVGSKMCINTGYELKCINFQEIDLMIILQTDNTII